MKCLPLIKPLLLLTLSLSFLNARSQYWQQQVNHRISVSLNDSAHTLDGYEKIEYINNSPDTLRFIWFHIWPNAFKNDKTAFSEQLLVNGRTDFYFSKKEQRGYINRLDFRVDNIHASTEDHPLHIDIIKVILPTPLAPGGRTTITTPFHVQLPDNFSRGGHDGQQYQLTQWYPKPAVYDKEGWHPMPYLDQGEYYNEFGDYEVNITLPANYAVAATGVLQEQSEKEWLAARRAYNWEPIVTRKLVKEGSRRYKKKFVQEFPVTATETKTISFKQSRVTDFAWFADKRYRVLVDTASLPSGRVVATYSYYLPSKDASWNRSPEYIRRTLRHRSSEIGEYPYNVVTVVDGRLKAGGGMEYPTITNIADVNGARALENVIEHEVGHNWFYGILSSNERDHTWMDEGMNSFYDLRYKKTFDPAEDELDGNFNEKLLQTLYSIRKDQPIETKTGDYTAINYAIIAYHKTPLWLQELERILGKTAFDSVMRGYYQQWKFRHPQPEDFRNTAERLSGRDLKEWFALRNSTGDFTHKKRPLRVTVFSNLKKSEEYNYISILPAIGANRYDKFMIGAMVHNYGAPVHKLRFLAVPLYATGSKQFNYLARLAYGWYPGGLLYKTELGVAASRFSMDDFTPPGKERLISGFSKFVPFVRVTLAEHALSHRIRYLQFKHYQIKEDALNFRTVISGQDTNNIVETVPQSRYLNQLKFVVQDTRALYPYSGEFQVEQAKQFVRLALTATYFLNYPSPDKIGGIKARLFAGKFIYAGSKTISKQFETDRYHLNMTGANGYEDYTYSTYFMGRNEFEGAASQQIMQRDGAFKVRSDLLSSKIGKTDDWLAAINLVADIPIKKNPLNAKFPVKIFADIGTYSESWEKEAATSKFLFDAGLQFSLFNETLNIYVPILYSKEYRDYFKSTLGEKRFLKTISFGIDLGNFSLRKLVPSLDL